MFFPRTTLATARSSISETFSAAEWINVAYWHQTDMPTLLRNVRSQGQSGKHVLALSFSGFDPKETSIILPQAEGGGYFP